MPTKLTWQDVEHFYELLFSLMDYANRKRKIVRRFPTQAEMRATLELTPQMAPVLDSIWKDTSILDAYLTDHPELPEEDRETVLSWKRRVKGIFVLAVAGSDGALMFCATGRGKVYQVRALRNSWDEIQFVTPPPLILETTLIPYKGWIVYDGTLRTYKEPLPSNIAAMALQLCRQAKKQGTIITAL